MSSAMAGGLHARAYNIHARANNAYAPANDTKARANNSYAPAYAANAWAGEALAQAGAPRKCSKTLKTNFLLFFNFSKTYTTMVKKRGPFPTKDTDFDSYINQAIPYMGVEKVRLSITNPNVTAMNAKLADWNVLFPKTQDDTQRTTTLTGEKNDLREEIEDLLRAVYDDIPESVLTTEDRDKLNLQERDDVPTDTEVPANPPDIELKETGVGFQRVHAQNFEDPDFDGRPDGVSHIRASWHMGDNPPANPRDFDKMKDFTTANFKVDFAPEDAGKMVHLAIRYIGHRGQEGPWSKVVSVGIA